MKRFLMVILSLLLLVSLQVGCSKKENTVNSTNVAVENKSKINVAVPDGVTTLSVIKMLKDKPSFGENIETNYDIVKSPDLMASKVISKQADIAIVPTNLASMLYNKNVPYKLAASNIWGVFYIASSEEIKSITDLKGKEIFNTGKGLTPDVVFRYILSKNGLNPDTDVKINYLSSPQELAQAMIAGKCKNAVLPEPVLTQVLMKNKAVKIVVDIQKEWEKASGTGSSYPQASLLISNELIEKKPAVVDSFLKEFESSIEWVNNNPAQAGALAEELQTGMNPKVVENAIAKSNIRYMSAKNAKPAIESYLKVLMDFSPKSIGGKLPDEKFYLQK